MNSIPIRPSVVLSQNKAEVLNIAISLGVTDVRIFGSVARGTDGFSSDIDFMLTPNPSDTFSIYRFASMVRALLNTKVNVLSDAEDETHFDNPVYLSASRDAIPLETFSL